MKRRFTRTRTYPARSPPGDAHPRHILDTIGPDTDLPKKKGQGHSEAEKAVR